MKCMKLHIFFMLILLGIGRAAVADSRALAREAYERKNYIDAYEQFLVLQDDNSGNACYYLGVMNQQGWGKVADTAAAAQFYECAISHQHLKAMHNLAGLYHRGSGVEQDLEKARSLYARSANLGGAKSAHRLGLIYFQGDGVERDFDTARDWWQKAFDGG